MVGIHGVSASALRPLKPRVGGHGSHWKALRWAGSGLLPTKPGALVFPGRVQTTEPILKVLFFSFFKNSDSPKPRMRSLYDDTMILCHTLITASLSLQSQLHVVLH